MSQPAAHRATRNNARRDFYERIGGLSMAPLWESMHQLVPPQPAPKYQAAHWDYDKVRPYLMESGSLITAKEAVRRVLILENPAMQGSACITPSLYAGLQLILPGEVAPSHRHTQSALRFIVEGEGAYTASTASARSCARAISSSRRPGPGTTTATSRRSRWSGSTASTSPWWRCSTRASPRTAESDEQVVTAPEGTSDARYGSGLLPVDWKPERQTSPIFNYPYARTREALAAGQGRPARSLPRLQAALRQPGKRRRADRHHGHLHAAPAQGLQDRALSQHRRHGVLGGRGHGASVIGDQDLPLEEARPLRRAELGQGRAPRRGRRGAVLLLRPSGARKSSIWREDRGGRWCAGSRAATPRHPRTTLILEVGTGAEAPVSGRMGRSPAARRHVASALPIRPKVTRSMAGALPPGAVFRVEARTAVPTSRRRCRRACRSCS